jgi:hypothetical protein
VGWEAKAVKANPPTNAPTQRPMIALMSSFVINSGYRAM